MEKDFESPLALMVLIMKKPFEDYLAFIENDLGCKLLDWQKTILHEIYDGKHPVVYRRLSGKFVALRAAALLKEEMERDTGNFLTCLYKLDDYTADVPMCDEDWESNIELEKEN